MTMLLLMLLLTTVSPGEAAPPGPGYTLVFQDNFTGATLDTQKWATCHACWRVRQWRGWGQQQLYVERGYKGLSVMPHRLAHGVLSLVAAVSPSPPTTAGAAYTSGMVSTEESHNRVYGYFEVRARVPAGEGLWSMITLLPSNCATLRPEISLLEVLGHDPGTLYQVPRPLDDGDTRWHFGGPVHHLFALSPTAFQVYGLEWTPQYIAWSVNGRETQRVETYTRIPHYLVLALAVGGPWASAPTPATVFPARMMIDYVRIYRRDR